MFEKYGKLVAGASAGATMGGVVGFMAGGPIGAGIGASIGGGIGGYRGGVEQKAHDLKINRPKEHKEINGSDNQSSE